MKFTEREESTILRNSGLSLALGLDVIDQVRLAYKSPDRHYHNWDHALSVLSWTNQLRRESTNVSKDDISMALAALYHDAVYTMQGSPMNEEQSVRLMRSHQVAVQRRFDRGSANSIHVSDSDFDLAEEMIKATAQHGKFGEGDVPAKVALFLDCDIASFGEARWDVVVSTDSEVCEELLQKFGADEVRKGRVKFLNMLLSKREIFLSEYFYERFEKQARKNIIHILRVISKTGEVPCNT